MDPAPDCGRPVGAGLRRLRQEPGGGRAVGSQNVEGGAGRDPQASGRIRKERTMIENLLSGPLADAVSRALFHFLWEGALMAAALAVAIHVFRPSSASIRYGLACAAMLAMVLAFSVTLAWNWPHSTSVTIQSN